MIRFTDPLSKATAPKFPPLGPTDRAVKQALLLAVSKIKKLYVAASVTRALEANDIDRAVSLIRWDVGEEFLMSVLPQHLRSAYELAGHDGAKWLATETGVTVTFNIITPQAVDWIRTHAAELISQWGDSSREAIRDMIVNAFQHPDTTTISRLAREIKTDGIGLTKQQTQWVANMRARLIADGRKPDQVDRMAERYSKRLLRMRTEMIARTELKRAQTEAQKEQWRQSIEAGLIDPNDSVMEWTTRIDPRTCEDCVELDGARAEIPGGEFRTDSGLVSSGPPEHPQCRCMLIVVPRDSKHKPSRAKPNDETPGIRPISTLRG